MISTDDVEITTENGFPELLSREAKFTNFSASFICKGCGKHHYTLENEDSYTAQRRCTCGNDKFYAHQKCYHGIIVTGDNIFEREVDLYEAESPYGEYECTKCGTEYEYREDIPLYTA